MTRILDGFDACLSPGRLPNGAVTEEWRSKIPGRHTSCEPAFPLIATRAVTCSRSSTCELAPSWWAITQLEDLTGLPKREPVSLKRISSPCHVKSRPLRQPLFRIHFLKTSGGRRVEESWMRSRVSTGIFKKTETAPEASIHNCSAIPPRPPAGATSMATMGSTLISTISTHTPMSAK